MRWGSSSIDSNAEVGRRAKVKSNSIDSHVEVDRHLPWNPGHHWRRYRRGKVPKSWWWKCRHSGRENIELAKAVLKVMLLLTAAECCLKIR